MTIRAAALTPPRRFMGSPPGCPDFHRPSRESQCKSKTPAVTDSQREAAGLPVYKTDRTAAPVPDTHPVLYCVNNEHPLQRL